MSVEPQVAVASEPNFDVGATGFGPAGERVQVGAHPWRATAPSQRTLNGMLDALMRDRPNERLLDTPDLTLTAAQLRTRMLSTAALFGEHGVLPGHRVVVMTANRIEIVDLLCACGWTGATLVPINPAARGESLRHQLSLADPTLIVTDHSTLDVVIETLATITADVAPILLVDTPAFDGHQNPARGADTTPKYRLPHPDAASQPAEIDQHTVLALLWTSGTTGPSKAVMIPHGQYFWWGVNVTEQMGLRPDDVLYTCLPLFHTNALTTFAQAMACGGRAVLGPRFSVSRWWSSLAEAEATVTYLLGAMSRMLWNRRPEPGALPGHRVQRLLGGGMDPALKPEFERYFRVQVLEGFGMTEVGVPIYTPVEWPDTPGMGVAHPDYELLVVDADGEAVTAGEVGELVIRPRRPALMSSGYWRNDGATRDARRDLWFHTGDLVTCDDAGIYRFFNRKSDSMRRRGENISAHEVEAAFLALPDVSACAAYAVPSEIGEDEVMLAVVANRDDAASPADLLRAVTNRLAEYAQPRFIRFVDELPLTENGKVRKRVLRDEGRTADTWDREATG